MLGFSPISTAPICAQVPKAVGAITYAITDWSGPTFIGIVGPDVPPSAASGSDVTGMT